MALSYYGSAQVKKCSKSFSSLSDETFGTLLQVIRKHFTSCGDIHEDEFKSLKIQLGSIENIDVVYSTLIILFDSLLKLHESKDDVWTQRMNEEMQRLLVPAALSNSIVSTVKDVRNSRIIVSSNIQHNHFPALVDTKWRIDVIVSTSSDQKKFTPRILLELQLSNGECTVIELTVQAFHNMRHSVARLLKEMMNAELNCATKIRS